MTSQMMKSYIADALLILMEKKEYADITIGEIVAKAGVNRSTYYRHFEKKDDVILFFLDRISKTILEWDKEKKSDFEEHLINVYKHYHKHKKQMMLIYRSGLSVLFLDVLKNYLGKEAHKEKSVQKQYDIAFHIGGTFNQFMMWFSRDMKDSPEAMAKYTLAILPENYRHHVWGEQKG